MKYRGVLASPYILGRFAPLRLTSKCFVWAIAQNAGPCIIQWSMRSSSLTAGKWDNAAPKSNKFLCPYISYLA